MINTALACTGPRDAALKPYSGPGCLISTVVCCEQISAFQSCKTCFLQLLELGQPRAPVSNTEKPAAQVPAPTCDG